MRSFNKHLAKKYEITKETHAASASGTTSGRRQTQLGGWTMQMPSEDMPFNYNRNEMMMNFRDMSLLKRCHLIIVKIKLMSISLNKLCNHTLKRRTIKIIRTKTL